MAAADMSRRRRNAVVDCPPESRCKQCVKCGQEHILGQPHVHQAMGISVIGTHHMLDTIPEDEVAGGAGGEVASGAGGRGDPAAADPPLVTFHTELKGRMALQRQLILMRGSIPAWLSDRGDLAR